VGWILRLVRSRHQRSQGDRQGQQQPSRWGSETLAAVAGQPEIAAYRQVPPDRLSRLSEAQLAVLAEINGIDDADDS